MRHAHLKWIAAGRILLLALVLIWGARPSEAGPRITNAIGAPDGTAPVVTEVRVAIDAHPERQPTYAAMARRIIGLREGHRLTPEAVATAVEALTLSNRFAAIHVDSIPEPGGEALVLTLTPYRYVEDIRIRGKYPLFERDILNQMTLYPGDPYTRAQLSDQIDGIAARYRREGYIAPRVSITDSGADGVETSVIDIDIDKGPHYALGSLTVEGNRGLSDSTLKWRMQVWRSSRIPGAGRFSEYRLQKDIDRLRTYYRKKGFADVDIAYRVDAPDARHRVDVNVAVEEGPRYRIDFEGNRRFWDRTLKKDLTLFTGGNRSGTGVRKSVRNMQNRYRQAGFLDVRIKAIATDIAETAVPERHIRFVIQEGPQTLVERVTLAGKHTLPEKEIRKQILVRPPGILHAGAFVPETLEEDVYALSGLFTQRGYRENRVDPEVTFNADRSRAAVVLNIDAGPQTTIRSQSIQGLTVLPEAAAREVLVHRVGDPLQPATLEAEKEALASLVSEKGYPHASVDPRVAYSEDHTRADIVYTVEEGPHVALGQIFISGNLKTKESVIRRELEVEPGASLSLRTLHEGQRRLRDTAIFHGVRYRTFGLKEKHETVNLFVEVEEEKPYYAQIGAGYESDSGFFGRTRIGDRNLFGLNKDLWASAEVSQTGHRLETRLTEPRFLGTRTTASIGAFNEEVAEFNQSFGTRTSGGSIGFGREWNQSFTTALVFSLEKRDLFDVGSQLTTTAEEESRTIFVTTPTIRYDTRDSFVRPTHGFYASLGVDISKGFENRWDDFVRYQLDMRLYRTPVEGLTLAAMARVGQIRSYSDAGGVPDDQLFFLGGIGDVRGFKENLLRFDAAGDPVGGRTAMVGSLEARIDIGSNWELTAFFDIGSLSDAQVEAGSDDFRASVGCGLRYITPIGPMGLLYGHKLDRLEGESAGQLHISIGYSF